MMAQWNAAHKPRARAFFKRQGRREGWEGLFESKEAPAKLAIKNLRFCVEILPFADYVKAVGKDKVPENAKGHDWVLIAMLKRHDSEWLVVIPPTGLRDFPEGNIAIETYGSRVKFNKVEVTARFEEEWLKEEYRRD